jgi:hypothetical protein
LNSTCRLLPAALSFVRRGKLTDPIADFEHHSDVTPLAFLAPLAYTRGMRRAPDRPHSKYEHVYPIVRIDLPLDSPDPTNKVTVAKVLTSQAAAENEAARLNQINADKSCVYFYCTSRLIEQSANSALSTEGD